MGKMNKLKLTEIHPDGWLLDQLKVQMNGLTGKLYEIWDSVGSYSGWLGGTGESWERAPYYLDGLLPLSYYLGDKEHMDLCKRFIEWTLNSQREDGNFGPGATAHEQWSRYAMLKVLIQYEEITGDERVVPFVYRYLNYFAEVSKTIKIREWSEARVPDLMYVAKWLYDKTGDDSIPGLMKRIDESSLDWCDFLEDLPFPRPASYYINWKPFEEQMSRSALEDMVPYHFTHIVNVTMGFKHPAVRAVYDKSRDYAALAKEGIQEVIRRHGVASGCINGDEHLAGNNPVQGSELCSVVEYMFSLQGLIESFGDPFYGDLMERVAYNALPATITEDFMAHQYLQQANQIIADDTVRPWFNNNNESSMFGLEPNFGCCTANLHQGWPKFVNSLWYKENASTIVNMVLAPCRVETELAAGPAAIRLETGYPFKDSLTYVIENAPAGEICIKIRIPGWCKEPVVNAGSHKVEIDAEGHWILVSGLFTAGEQILLKLPMTVEYSSWYRGSVAVERGPLLYGLDIQEEWVPKRCVAGVTDYCVFPKSDWNYAICKDNPVEVEECDISERPFSKKSAPVRLRVKAGKVDSWGAQGGNTGELPVGAAEVSKEESVDLIPFGCTKLRISQFPFYEAD